MEDVQLKEVRKAGNLFYCVVKGVSMDYAPSINTVKGTFVCTCAWHTFTFKFCKHLKALLKYVMIFYKDDYNNFIEKWEDR